MLERIHKTRKLFRGKAPRALAQQSLTTANAAGYVGACRPIRTLNRRSRLTQELGAFR